MGNIFGFAQSIRKNLGSNNLVLNDIVSALAELLQDTLPNVYVVEPWSEVIRISISRILPGQRVRVLLYIVDFDNEHIKFIELPYSAWPITPRQYDYADPKFIDELLDHLLNCISKSKLH